MVKHSLGLRSSTFSLSDEIFLLNLNEVRPCACASLVVFVDDNVLFLVSLTTTHGEAGLPTSTAQRGGLREVGTQGRSLGLGSDDLSDQAYSQ
jgi:hypothetical protein